MTFTLFKAGLVAAVAMSGLVTTVAAQTQSKLSDKSVNTLMEYAWQILPSKFTTPAGKVIEVDKSKREANIVPVENGREIIRVAYSSAQAQVCELWEEQQANFDTLMRREHERKKWTEQQMLYITTLHRMTIHAVAGKLRVEEKAGELKVLLEPIKPGEGKCSDEQKAKVRDTILAYVKIDAPPQKGAAAPAASPTKKK
jgi:hypothetical protein